MKRSFYLNLAVGSPRIPIGTDLVLHEHSDAAAILLDGRRLGQVMEEGARRYRTPLAIPLMDLRLEKADTAAALGIAPEQADGFHYTRPPGEEAIERVRAAADAPFSRRNQAHIDSIRYIAQETDLIPLGMAIGPFSLATKLMADPITPIAMAGTGVTSDEDPSVRMVEQCLALAELAVARSLRAQMGAGAKAVIICEPAANVVYLSPKQIERGSDVFERFVMEPDLRLKALLDAGDADLIFHDCGELNVFMVRSFAERLHPSILSLGSSRVLWEDAEIVPKDVVLFGNLPTKSFYSDAVMPDERVVELTTGLIGNMRKAGHPYILGSECDVLHVPEAAETIRRKVNLMLTAERGGDGESTAHE